MLQMVSKGMPMPSKWATGNNFTEMYKGPVIEVVVWMLHSEGQNHWQQEDNFSGLQSSKWHCEGLTCDLKVKVRGAFRIRHLDVMVRIRIRGLGNTLYLCVLTK